MSRGAVGRGVDRRSFLRIGLGAGGGLVVWLASPGARGLLGGEGAGVDAIAAGGTGATAPPALHPFGAFVAVDTDGGVRVTIPVPEIGQGVRTSLAMIVAEELDASWSSVRVEQAGAREGLGPHPMAGGSNAVRAYWTPLREAGATARALLLSAGAAALDVPESACVAEDGRVVHAATGRSVPYGEVAGAAAALPTPTDVRLKARADFRLVGRPVAQIDAPDIATGRARFGLDVRVPGMLRAVVARCPVYGGTPAAWDEAAALAVPGVRGVVPVDAVGAPERPYSVAGVAVVADDTWTAIRARDVLDVRWDEGPNAGDGTARISAACEELLARPGAVWREGGDVDAALAGSVRRVEATYRAPFIVHAPMEPMSCVAHVTDDRCEIWAPTQVPLPARANAAAVLGLPEEAVTLHVTRCGGGFGRRLSFDFVLEAVQVARGAGAPVQVVWTREDDVRHGFFRPFSVHRLAAGLDPAGRPTAWLHRQAGTSRYAFRQGENPARSGFRAATWPGPFLPAHRLEYALVESNLPRGPLRAPGHNAFVFAIESFLDEVAHAGGRDPLELRLEMLQGDRVLQDDDDLFEASRLAGVIRAAAERAGWGDPLPEGRGRGIAAGFTFGSYAAHVVEVEVARSPGAADRPGRVRVRRVVGAMDCGTVVNPAGARAQVEGGIVDGLSAALNAEVTVEGGRVVQSNFHDYPLLRASEAPAIETVLIDSDAPPTGAGEPPYPPVAPALANAIFDATGVRLRDLPLRAASG